MYAEQSNFAWHTFSHNNKQGKDVKASLVTLEMNLALQGCH